MTTEERARELWGKLPIIQEDYIPIIQAALEEQKAEYDSQLPLIKKTYYNAGHETAKNKMIDKACEWLMQNWNMGQAYINAQGKLCYRCIDDFRKAMED